MNAHEFPILEHDATLTAFLEPSTIVKPVDVSPHCVLCFFDKEITDLIQAMPSRVAAVQRSSLGEHPLYEIDWYGRKVAVAHAGLGAPLAIGLMEEIIARGCRKFIACGSCGALDKQLVCGHLVVPTSAIRDEGTSYHYLPPSREVSADPVPVAAIEATLQQAGVNYLLAKTWTTDAFYRETPQRVKRRRDEGCMTVEMEAAAYFALAMFRNVQFGQILYAGDDLSGPKWDSRQYNQRTDVRRKVPELSIEACLRL
ncbi:MAG: hypothetical protein EHM48_09835 [Planctomycetaceae bacterium]|nr:MAG: hypothetical protein EHM48_09835 [Planctomycetaceae bacterium]